MMVTALIIVGALASADVIICSFLLWLVSREYRRVRQAAAIAGQPLPSARGEFVFVGGLLIGGLLVLLSVIAWLISWRA